MTKKDFELIARVLARAKPVIRDENDAPAGREWEYIVYQFVWELVLTNPRFDAVRFIKACGEG